MWAVVDSAVGSVSAVEVAHLVDVAAEVCAAVDVVCM